MSVNGISTSTSAYQKYDTSNKTIGNTTSKANSDSNSSIEDTSAAVYETSSDSSTYNVKNSALIEQLKADSDNRISQMQSLVQKMFEKQGVKIGSADDMWKALASGDFTADADTIAQAKKDISEDGYWGVSQTADRILAFATALSGGDEAKMQQMKAAVEKGFQEATKSWGKNLPGISSDTHDAVMKKFFDWFTSNSTTSDEDAKTSTDASASSEVASSSGVSSKGAASATKTSSIAKASSPNNTTSSSDTTEA